MPQVVQHPKFGNIEFPDGMSREEMVKSIKKLEWEHAPDWTARAGMMMDWLMDPQRGGKTVVRMAPAAAGQMVPGPLGKFVAAPAGAVAGEVAAAAIDNRLPTKGEVADAAINSFARGKTGAGQVALNAAKYAGANVAGGVARSMLDSGTLPSFGEVADRANTGGIAAVAGIGMPNKFSKAEQQAMEREREYIRTLQGARESKLLVDPALVRPNNAAPITSKALSTVSGQSQLQQQMANWNQRRFQDLLREENGIPMNAPLNDATFKAKREELLRPYREVALSSTAGKAALEDWRQASFDERMAFKKYSKDKSNPDAKKEWVDNKAAKEKAEANLEGIAKGMNNPGLMGEILDSKRRLAILHWAETAADTAGGGVLVDPKVFGDALESGVGLTGRQEMIGRLHNIMPEVTTSRRVEGVDPKQFRFLRFALAHVATKAGGAVPRTFARSDLGQFLTGLPAYGNTFPGMPQQLLRFANLSEQDKRRMSNPTTAPMDGQDKEDVSPPQPEPEKAEDAPKRLSSFKIGKRYRDPDTREVRVYLGDGQFALA